MRLDCSGFLTQLQVLNALRFFQCKIEVKFSFVLDFDDSCALFVDVNIAEIDVVVDKVIQGRATHVSEVYRVVEDVPDSFDVE